MRSDVLDSEHTDKQKLAFSLYDKYPNRFIPLYTMISFTNIPYSKALKRGQIQDLILNKILSNKKLISDDAYIMQLVHDKLPEINAYGTQYKA